MEIKVGDILAWNGNFKQFSVVVSKRDLSWNNKAKEALLCRMTRTTREWADENDKLVTDIFRESEVET